MWDELFRLVVVCGFLALALLCIEVLILFRRDYLLWNSGICLETGDEWRWRERPDGKIELCSGEVKRVLNGWVLPFDPGCL